MILFAYKFCVRLFWDMKKVSIHVFCFYFNGRLNWYNILVTIVIVLWSWLNTSGKDYVKVGMRSENY